MAEDIDGAPAAKQAGDVTNEDYAREIYGAWFDRGWLSAGGRSGDGFRGSFAPDALRRMTPSTPNYFSVASMVDGARTRNDENFARAHVFAVDDVGQKIDADVVRGVLGEPQAIVETSAGNAQWHYWLAEPCDDADAWRALRDGMKAHPTLGAASDGNGLGAYYRLPVGASDKAGEKNGFATRLTRWAPASQRLSVADIAARMGVDLSPAAVKAVRDAVSGGRSAIDRAALSRDAVVGDFNLARMRAVGWPILDPRLSKGGFITIECPWSDEHTDGDRAAGYYVGDGGFKCFHAHCAGRGIKEFMARIGEIETPQTRAAATREIFECAGTGADDADRQNVEAMAQAAWAEEEDAQATMARYLFIKSQDRFVDLQTGLLLTRPVFNSTALALGEAGRSGMKSAASVFFNDGGRQVDSMTYLPGREKIIADTIDGMPATLYNSWAPGDIAPAADAVSAADVAPWLDHVKYIIEKEEERETFLDWVAFVVRHQDRKVNFAVLLKSEQGVGKDMMISPLYSLLGKNNVACIGSAAIDGQFNGFLENRLVIIEELPSFRKTDVYDRLKAWVSTAQKYTTINEKYMKPYAVRNAQAWLMMTNHDDAMALPADDRRYFVISSDALPRAAEYYESLAATLADPAFLSRLYRWLNDRDLSRFNAMGRAPDTDAKMAMVKATRQPLDAWIAEEMEDGVLAGRRLVAISEITATLLADRELPRDVKVDDRLPVKIGKALRRAGWELITRYRETTGEKCKQTIFIRWGATGVHESRLRACYAQDIMHEWTKERNEAAAERMRHLTP